ncbi:hypothetical protein I6N95_11890 [Vagococcus sp. BWB3-3]|uniref:Uncharacterized protein n=1 Tax=Vagococcus allomyrinae TaxID=2794353 RepID=A0A940PBH7_9ENTE|nr:hypothetical protein [Vagococcus allomyrinae]MBP1041710.1 hypothetical protein [Vagococcus allomyrinae]
MVRQSFKKATFWNMVLLVFGSVNGVMSIVEIPAILKPETKVDMSNPSLVNVTDPAIIKTVEKSMTILTNPFYQLYMMVMLVVGLVLIITFFQNHQALLRGQPILLWPYYGHLIKLVLAICMSIFTGSALISPLLTLTTLGLNVAWALPAILVLYYVKRNH